MQLDGTRVLFPVTHIHYKGGLYRKLGEALLEATCEEAVIYQSCSDGQVWVRPRSSFEGEVERDGIRVLRFAPMEQARRD